MADSVTTPRPRLSLPFKREKRPRTPTTVTAIDLDGLTLRVCQAVSRSSGPAITRLASTQLELPPETTSADPLIFGQALRSALDRLRIKPSSVVMGVPRALVVLRTLLLPPTQNSGELASLVHFQAGRDLPFRPEDAVIDFQVRRTVTLPQRPPTAGSPQEAPAPEASLSRLEVLVAVVKRETIEFHQQLAEKAGLKLAALGFLPHAHARCIQACHVADADDAFALVSLRPDEVTIEVLSRDALLFSRATTLPHESSPNPDSPEPNPAAPRPESLSLVQHATRETLRSLHAFSGSEPDTAVSKIVVAGATGLESELSSLLADRLGLPTTSLNPADALQLPPDSQADAAGALGALGLALGLADSTGLPFDFLNPKRPPVQRDTRRLKILASVVGVVALVIGTLAIRSSLVRRETARLDQLTSDLAAADKKRPTYRRTLLQAAAVDDWIKSDRDWTALYAHLSAVLPPAEDIYLKSIVVTGQGGIRLSVQARSGEIIARLDRQLRSAGYEVKPIAITPGSDRFGYDFTSNVELIVPPKLKVDLSNIKPPPRPSDDASLDPTLFRKGGA